MTSASTDLLDGISTSVAVKAPVKAVSIVNITLSGEQTVDGTPVVTGDRVLVNGQTDATENGIWVVDTSAWERAADFNGNRDARQGTLVVKEGITPGSLYQLLTANPVVIGTSSINFGVATSPSVTFEAMEGAGDVGFGVDQLPEGQYVADKTSADTISGVWNFTAVPTISGNPILDTADIGVGVQAWSAILDATTASFTVADETKLDAIDQALSTTDSPSFDGVSLTGGGNALNLNSVSNQNIVKSNGGNLNIYNTDASGNINLFARNETGDPTVQIQTYMRLRRGIEFGDGTNLGNDTTLERLSAGELGIEGNQVHHFGNLIAVAQGGTGAATEQAAIDNLTDAASGLTDQVWTRNASGQGQWAASQIGGGNNNDIMLVAGATGLNIATGTFTGSSIEVHGLLGTTGEIEVTDTGADIQIGLPSTISSTVIWSNNQLFSGGAHQFQSGSTLVVDCAHPSGTDNVAYGTSPAFNAAASDNVLVGIEAGGAAMGASSVGNVFIGSSAGASGSFNGADNIFIGLRAGDAATAMNSSIAIGTDAMGQADTEDFNIAIGGLAMSGPVAGAENCVVVGYNSGIAITSADTVTIVGARAGQDITSGGDNTLMGYSSGNNITTGTDNTVIGAGAGSSITTPNSNTVVGASALASASALTGANNSVFGAGAGQNMAGTATDNTIIGSGAGSGFPDDSVGNVLLGHGCGVTGSGACDNNVVIGTDAWGSASKSGADFNTMVGYGAGFSLTTGDYNVFLGSGAGNSSTLGLRNTLLGADTDTSGPSISDEIVIGYGAQGTGANDVVIGNGTTYIQCDWNVDAVWNHTSDERQKKNITDDMLGLDFIELIQPVTYEMLSPSEFPEEWTAYDPGDTTPIAEGRIRGLIAQDVLRAMEQYGVMDFAGWSEGPDGRQTVGFEAFILPLINAVKELAERIRKLEEK